MIKQQSNSELPAKTCTIDRLVTIPADVKKVIQGKKTATRRNGRYADIGEIMILENKQFIVERVYSQALGELTEENAKQEGFDSIEEYKQTILSYHPGMPWLPQMRVWVHEFRQISE
ncbi:ASCH domain-containing protein [Bacillus sp. T3]|uniref:ASCH domain-containing protein n=1 Tax=Bacillus sp. T3 TaxID=467262 RepID=UPI0029818AC0|nr:ASCH domain-containing protein [Bacillus sp. T3]